MPSLLSTESCTGNGDNKELDFCILVHRTNHFLIGGSTLSVRGRDAPQHARLERPRSMFSTKESEPQLTCLGCVDEESAMPVRASL